MGYTTAQILAPQVIMRTMSRLALPGTSLSQLFGWNVGRGPTNGAILPIGNQDEGGDITPAGNTEDYDLRTGQYDIFDNTRRVATGSVPDSPANPIAPQKVGSVQFTIPRTSERMLLSHEKLNNQRRIGGPANEVDRGGIRYIQAQTRYMAQRIANLIEFQTAAMLRGQYYFSQQGDLLHHSFTSGDYSINYQIPATHKSQLDLGTGSDVITATWATVTNDIPGMIYGVNRAFIDQVGVGISHLICNSKVYQNIINNNNVKGQAGTANTPYLSQTRVNGGEFRVRLRAIPWLEIHVIDYLLEHWNPSSEVYETALVIPDNIAVFIPEVDNSWTHYIRGGETVTEGPNGVTEFRRGMYAYAYPEHDPSGWNLHTLHNGFPALPVPKAIAYGTVVF